MSPTRTTSQLTRNLRICALIFVMVVALVTILGKGGGDAPPAPPADTTPPTVSSSTPADNSTDVARDTTATATFSEAMDAGTIDTTSFSLRDGKSAIIPAMVSLDMSTNIATLMPNQFLNLLTSYTATLSTVITDQAGNALASAVDWSFRSEDGQWGMAAPIENNNGFADSPKVAFDANGNALAVWRQHDGMRSDIYSNRFTAGSGWGAMPTRIGTGDFGNEFTPQIAIDPNGNAIAIWAKDDATCCRIFTNRYTLGSGWGTPEEMMGIGTSQASNPQIAIDANGNGIAVWAAGDISASIHAARYNAGTGQWEAPVRIKTDLMGGNASWPDIAIDTNGNAIAVWEQLGGLGFVMSNRYDAGTGTWGTEEIVGEIDVSRPQVAFDPNGNAITVWAGSNGMRVNIWANRYDAGTGTWGSGELIETDDGGDASEARIAFDSEGNAIAVWSQNSDMGTRDARSNRYAAGTGWGVAETIETHAEDAFGPQIAIDPNGNAIAVWEHSSAMFADNIRANRYTAGVGWGTDELIETDDGEVTDGGHQDVAIDGDGNVIAVWHQFDGSSNSIYANRLQ
jgi:hypothetical protein